MQILRLLGTCFTRDPMIVILEYLDWFVFVFQSPISPFHTEIFGDRGKEFDAHYNTDRASIQSIGIPKEYKNCLFPKEDIFFFFSFLFFFLFQRIITLSYTNHIICNILLFTL